MRKTSSVKLGKPKTKRKLSEAQQKIKAERKAFKEGKAKFRQSVAWKSFRSRILEKYGYVCQFCGNKYTSRTLVCHHKFVAKDLNDYMDLSDESRFTCLCHRCHTLCHKLAEIKGNSSSVEATREAIRPVIGDDWADLKKNNKPIQEQSD